MLQRHMLWDPNLQVKEEEHGRRGRAGEMKLSTRFHRSPLISLDAEDILVGR